MGPANGERSRLREWWPELAWVAVMAGVCLPMRDGVAGFAVMIAFTSGFWWMGHRHRRLPLHDTINGIYAGMEQMNEQLTDALPAPGPQRPGLHVVRD